MKEQYIPVGVKVDVLSVARPLCIPKRGHISFICPLQAAFAVRKTDDVDPIGVNTTMTPAPLEENTFAKAIAA
jgi:hypothetical protein